MLSLDDSTTTVTPLFSDTLERLRLTANLNSQQWFDILQLSWNNYQQMKLGHLIPSDKIAERVADYFNISTEAVLAGQIDYRSVGLRFDSSSLVLPEAYSKAAYGRKRTSITSVHFLEVYAGWRLRLDALRKLCVSESMLQDPFAPISMKFITDLCDYLHRRQFQKMDFFAMGAYTYEANQQTLVAKLFSELPSAKDAYEFFFNECMKLFEQNCVYTITQISDSNLTVEFLTNPDVGAESGLRHLGSAHVCQVKSGLIANIPRYLGLPASRVKEVACVHCGDDVCRLEVDFSVARNISLSQLSLNH